MNALTNQLPSLIRDGSRHRKKEQEQSAAITAPSSDELKDLTLRAVALLHSTNQCRFALGDVLLHARSKLRGQFTRWVETEVGLELRTAQLYMAASRFFRLEQRETVSHLPAGVLFVLAAKRRSDLVMKALEARAAGRPVTAEIVRTWSRSGTGAVSHLQGSIWLLRLELAKIPPEHRGPFMKGARVIGVRGLRLIANLFASIDRQGEGDH